MNNVCPCCRRPYGPSQDRVDSVVAEMKSRCADAGRWVGIGETVDEQTAAWLLAIAPGTLRNQRGLGRAPPHLRRGRGVVRYELRALAESLLQ